MTVTAGDIVSWAVQDLGVLGAGETLSAADAAFGLAALNRKVDQWAAEQLSLYAVVRSTWTIVSGTTTYTIGTGGAINIARPMYIDHLNMVDTSPTPDLEIQLAPLTDDQWAAVPNKALTSVYPTSWYLDRSSPLATLYLWPVPTSSTLLGAIYVSTAVAEFSGLTTVISLPPGYRQFLVKSLAVELAPAYERQDAVGLLMQQAQDAMGIVKRSNTQLMDMSFDGGALIQSNYPGYSIYTGP